MWLSFLVSGGASAVMTGWRPDLHAPPADLPPSTASGATALAARGMGERKGLSALPRRTLQRHYTPGGRTPVWLPAWPSFAILAPRTEATLRLPSRAGWRKQ